MCGFLSEKVLENCRKRNFVVSILFARGDVGPQVRELKTIIIAIQVVENDNHLLLGSYVCFLLVYW